MTTAAAASAVLICSGCASNAARDDHYSVHSAVVTAASADARIVRSAVRRPVAIFAQEPTAFAE
ncbi:MAG: hypothetical protein AAF747_08445 [Planctomycetota bacterium]